MPFSGKGGCSGNFREHVVENLRKLTPLRDFGGAPRPQNPSTVQVLNSFKIKIVLLRGSFYDCDDACPFFAGRNCG